MHGLFAAANDYSLLPRLVYFEVYLFLCLAVALYTIIELIFCLLLGLHWNITWFLSTLLFLC